MNIPEREVHVAAGDVHVEMPEQAPPVVEVKTDVHVPEQAAPQVVVAAAKPPDVVVNVEAAKPRTVRVEEDPETGDRLYVTE